jgi:hypothetical protein
MNMSISLFVSHPCLTVRSSPYTLFTPNQVYPFVHVYHWAISWRFHKRLSFDLVELMYCWFWASTLHGVSPLLSHVIMISLVPSCICLVWLSKRMSSLIVPRNDSVWKFLPRWVMSSSTLECEKVLFPFWASARVAGPRRSSNGAQHKESHEVQSDFTRCYVIHAWKEKWHGWPRSLIPFNCLTVLLATQLMHLSLFLVPPPS